jgi:hypothetical protein
MKTFIWTFLAVLGGIYVFTKLAAAKKLPSAQGILGSTQGIFAGPDIDQKTGAYTPPGSGAGTVGFTSSANDVPSTDPQKF